MLLSLSRRDDFRQLIHVLHRPAGGGDGILKPLRGFDVFRHAKLHQHNQAGAADDVRVGIFDHHLYGGIVDASAGHIGKQHQLIAATGRLPGDSVKADGTSSAVDSISPQ